MSYGGPPCIPLKDAAAAAGMSRDQLKAALGPTRVIIVSPVKLAVTPANLEAVAPGASAGLKTVNPSDQDAFDSWVW